MNELTKSNMQNKLKKYLKLENEILAYIENLPNNSEDCTCTENTYFEVVEYINADTPSVARYCLDCGGTCKIGE